MSNVFISYSRQDETAAKALVDDIDSLGHTVWFDQELSGGQVWWDKILDAIRECDVFVFALSMDGLNSVACKREFGYAADLGKLILPVALAGEISTNLLPPALSQIQLVDYQDHDRDAAFRLARAFNTLPPPKALPEHLPEPPEVPISYLASLFERVETTSTLDYEEQSVLLLDLKRSMRDPETANDARALLKRLRKRRDLLATIAEEIKELLGSVAETSQDIPQETTPGSFPKDDTIYQEPQKANKDVVEEKGQRSAPRFKERALSFAAILVIIGLHAAAGILLAIIADEITYYSSGGSYSNWRLDEETLLVALGGWTLAFIVSVWLWNIVRRAANGNEKATRRFRAIFRNGVSPKVALVLMSLIVLVFNIGVGGIVFDEWSRVW